MKDKEAREAIKKGFQALGNVLDLNYLDQIHSFTVKQPRTIGFPTHEGRIATLEAELAEKKEAQKPTCKTCGQKIQDGFRAGDVEAVAAGVRKTDNPKSRK